MTDTRESKPVIGHVLHRLYLAGAEVLAAALARRLQERYRFVFYCLDEIGPLGHQLANEGFEVVDLARQPGVDWSVARRLRQHARSRGVQLLHAHQYTPFFYAAVSRGVSAAPKVLFTEHGRHWPDQRRPKRVMANRLLLRRADRVTAVGSFVRTALIDNEGLPAARVQVVHNGIDPILYTSQESDRDTRGRMRTELGVAADELVVLQVARFHPVKDHLTAIRAFADTVKQVPNARLLLAGDGDEREKITETIETLGVAGRVSLLGVREDVPALMAAADLFMLSSVSEGISVTLLEAMAAGLPIVATDVGGNSEVVEHGQTGLLSPRADSSALAVNMVGLLSDGATRNAFGQAGRERLMKLFTQDRMHAAYCEIYDQMLGLAVGAGSAGGSVGV